MDIINIIIIVLIVAYFLSYFRSKLKGTLDRVETEKQKKESPTGFPDTVQDLIETIRKSTREKPIVVKSQSPIKKGRDIEADKPLESPKGRIVEGEYPPLDTTGIPEGGRLSIVRLQDGPAHNQSASVLEQLLGSTEESKREQLRRAVILKEVIDRKY